MVNICFCRCYLLSGLYSDKGPPRLKCFTVAEPINAVVALVDTLHLSFMKNIQERITFNNIVHIVFEKDMAESSARFSAPARKESR